MADKVEEVVPKVEVEETEAEDGSKDPESEEPQAYFEPVVKLDEVEVVSGEEDEEVLFKIRAKLFCFRETLLDKGTGKKSWCERGVGDVRFLKHKEHQKVRLLMRQEKTHKIIINHLVDTRTELSPNMGSDRAWVFSCYDFAEGTLETQVFALRFANAENAQKFKEAHDNAKATNKALEAGADAADTAAGDDAAKALESLDVKKERLCVRAQQASTARRAFHQSSARFAITTVNVPSMGDSISEGTLVQIVKAVGETVHADEVVAILETDKVSVDVMSPVAGTIVEHLAKLEENVEVGRALFSVDDSRAPEPGSKPSPQSSASAPAPAAAAPAPAASPVALAATSGHRTPLIKFLGKRSLLPAKAPASQSQSAVRQPLAPVQPSGPNVLPFTHVKRVPLTPAEVDAINSGVAFL